MPPPIIALKDAAISFGQRPLFTALDIGIARGERACLVGRNGCGKSTLLKALAGIIDLDKGERFVQPGVAVAYLPQETPVTGDATVERYVAKACAIPASAIGSTRS